MEKGETGIGEATKSRLIDATLQSISENGIADTTTSKISEIADVSKATIHHYFDSKENLLYETMLHLLRLMKEQSQLRLKGALTPRAKLMAVVESVSLDCSGDAAETGGAWFSFWAQSDHTPGLARLMSIYSRRLRSHLRHFLAQMFRAELPEASRETEDLEHVVDGITSLIHGSFVSFSIGESKLDPAAAVALISEYLDMVIAAKRQGLAPR